MKWYPAYSKRGCKKILARMSMFHVQHLSNET